MSIAIGDSLISPDFVHTGIVVSAGTGSTHNVFFSNGVSSELDDTLAASGKMTAVDPPVGEPDIYSLVYSNFWTSNQIFLDSDPTGKTFPAEGWCFDASGKRQAFTVLQYFTVPATGDLVLCSLQSLDASEQTVIVAAGAQKPIQLHNTDVPAGS